MRIWYVTSECAPFSKSGGLADVAFSLPPVLKQLGDDVEIVTPLYSCVQERFGHELTLRGSWPIRLRDQVMNVDVYRGERAGVPVWFISQPELFLRGGKQLYGHGDDNWRFAVFSRAVVDLLGEISPMPDILHCNDWETAPVILYLKDRQWADERFSGIRTVFTIHNIAYQGQYAREKMYTVFDLDNSWYGRALEYGFEGREDINLMKGAMMMADAVTTVSPTYARELHHHEFGQGLEAVIDYVDNRLYGILNGIDEAAYDPVSDPRIPANFSTEDLSGKKACKTKLQADFGLVAEPEWPLVAVVARLVEQKGLDLIRDVLPGLMDLGVQVVVFGQGDARYEAYFAWASQRWKGQMGFSSDYTEKMASKVFAGADFYLMPSRFEPCGLSQMMAMRCGTVPIVHETGGLKDSVRPYSRFDGIGDGFSFSDYQSKDLLLAIQEALKVYFADEKTFTLLRKRCMQKDFSWLRSAEEYTRMYARIADDAAGDAVPFEDAYAQLRDAFIALDRENRVRYQDRIDPNYHRVIQFHITGRTDGVLHVSFSNGELEVAPAACDSADAYITAAFDQLLNMANGTISFDRLFLTGQLKVEGNLSKGAEIRQLLGKTGI